MRIVLICHKYGVSIDDPCCYPLGFMYISAVLKPGDSIQWLANAATTIVGAISGIEYT